MLAPVLLPAKGLDFISLSLTKYVLPAGEPTTRTVCQGVDMMVAQLCRSSEPSRNPLMRGVKDFFMNEVKKNI